MSNFKKIISFAIVISFSIPLVSCSDKAYIANMDYRKQKAFYNGQSRSTALRNIMQLTNTIINVVEKEATKELEQKKLLRLEANSRKIRAMTDNQFMFATFADVFKTQIEATSRVELARARSEAIRYLQPIIAAIYQEQSEKIGTPTTMNDIGMKFMEQLPFLSTVAGMYGLGEAGISAAGDKLTATFNGDNGAINNKSSVASDGSAISINGSAITGDNSNMNTGTSGASGDTTTTETTTTGMTEQKTETSK